MIQRLQKLSIKIFQQSLKTYTLQDVVKHKKSNPNNLIQICALYPNKGVGFTVWRLGWPDKLKIKVTETMLKSNRHGKMRGVKRLGNKQFSDIPLKFNGASKRGIWRYSVDQAQPIELDNGMVYTAADFKAYQASRVVTHKSNKNQEQNNNEQQEQNQQ